MNRHDPCLQFDNVRFSYGQRLILDGIDLDCQRQSVSVLMGLSGCGKTTMLSLAAGLGDPLSGRVARTAKRVGMMFQDPLLLPWRSALENVAFALKALAVSRKERDERARAILDAVGFPCDQQHAYPGQLSGGLRQRVSLARALVIDPDLLLLDEPFRALDIGLVRSMQGLLLDLVEKTGMSILMVTHDASDAARMADKVVLLSAKPARIDVCLDCSKKGRRSDEMALIEEIEAHLMALEV
ncbi:ATP-binding cassette domain-containing protein [uncultured Cohaesibacter sp.]|uniref:ABC transporter ATP-binding protein n=1 Tax=uncultured Cohaesibacter sp. TaxID=1002546 RepID=UPI00292FE46D|nr:ATP-binding cassette domain-containing protein [uncultured Cohaesibacter sp.]